MLFEVGMASPGADAPFALCVMLPRNCDSKAAGETPKPRMGHRGRLPISDLRDADYTAKWQAYLARMFE